jgi:Uma2 family endonuclease
MKRVITKIDFASDEEYFLYEEKSELRHELINGSLYEMWGISIYHNDIVLNILFLLRTHLTNRAYKITFESYKVRTPDGNYFYPDVMVCEQDAKKYYAEKPVLIVEVLSESTRKFNLVDHGFLIKVLFQSSSLKATGGYQQKHRVLL